MITKTRIVRTRTLDPWWNLAVEEYLLERVEKGECILYLWQNQNTVVIGKNQNPWKECRTELLECEKGKLARRLSGGGAVFHDTGNLNFTFLVDKAEYNLEKQVRVILEAVKSLGIDAEMTGRNDITADGRKFSGNAFCFKKHSAYHHGTVLVEADMDKMTRYLQVSAEKIRSKGIESVRSRVVNLSEFKPSLTIDEMADALAAAFTRLYGGEGVLEENLGPMDSDTLDELYSKYSSWDWRYGEAPQFDVDFDTRFPWGGIQIGLQLDKGTITKASVYSDALDEEFISMMPEALNGCIFNTAKLAEAVRGMQKSCSEDRRQMVEDIAGWLESKAL